MKLLIGFDVHRNDIRLMHADNKAHTAAGTARIHMEARLFTAEFYAEAGKAIEEYYRNNPALRPQQVTIILPNETIGFETFELPNMSKFKMTQAFEAELNNLFEGKQRERKYNRFFLKRTKQSTTFGVYYFDRAIVAELFKLFTPLRVVPSLVTFAANAALDSVFAYAMRARGKSFLFADVREEETQLVLSSRGKMLGFARLPHGAALLREAEVQSEYMITDHDVGELAVINARETARAKALTVSEEDMDDDEEHEEHEGEGEGAAEKTYDEAVREAAAITEDAPDPAAGEGSAEGGEEGAGENRVKYKVFRKTPKRYPKFMQRELPETAEGIAFENFRILMKWMLMYARQASLSDYAAPPEYILVNLPKELEYLLDKANEEQGSDGLQFHAFVAADKLPADLKDNLDLIGGLHGTKFNRDGNF